MNSTAYYSFLFPSPHNHALTIREKNLLLWESFYHGVSDFVIYRQKVATGCAHALSSLSSEITAPPSSDNNKNLI